jgi:anti-sigma B factor antagonist
LEIKIRERDNVTIFDIEGEIRRSDETVLSLHQLVKDLLKEGKRNFLLNFEKVNFIDSMGVGQLLACYKSVIDQRGQLKLMKLNPKIRLLFEVCALTRIFEIFDDEEEAVKSFSKDASGKEASGNALDND